MFGVDGRKEKEGRCKEWGNKWLLLCSETAANVEHCSAVQTAHASTPLLDAPLDSVSSQAANEQHSSQTPEPNHASSSAEQPLCAAPLVHT